MTIHEGIVYGQKLLSKAGVPDPKQDATLLLSYLTGLSPMETHLRSADSLSIKQEQRFTSLLLSRAQREPLQYLLGIQWFYGLPYSVDEHVLIPRQETEALCELGLSFLSSLASPTALDLCTGSGAIAVTLKHECPAAQVTATDISLDALAVARRNASQNGTSIRFFQGDLFVPVEKERFSLILSNPPYVESAACDALQPEVRREPRLALDGGPDGLQFYRRIVKEAWVHLTGGGMIAAEVGDAQAPLVAALFEETAHYTQVCIHNDLYGAPRIVSARIPEDPA